MSYWSHNVEKLEEVTIEFLPEPWKSKVQNDEIDLYDVPDVIRMAAMSRGTEDFFASRIDYTYETLRP